MWYIIGGTILIVLILVFIFGSRLKVQQYVKGVDILGDGCKKVNHEIAGVKNTLSYGDKNKTINVNLVLEMVDKIEVGNNKINEMVAYLYEYINNNKSKLHDTSKEGMDMGDAISKTLKIMTEVKVKYITAIVQIHGVIQDSNIDTEKRNEFLGMTLLSAIDHLNDNTINGVESLQKQLDNLSI